MYKMYIYNFELIKVITWSGKTELSHFMCIHKTWDKKYFFESINFNLKTQ